jgi:hypothetical protein
VRQGLPGREIAAQDAIAVREQHDPFARHAAACLKRLSWSSSCSCGTAAAMRLVMRPTTLSCTFTESGSR